eukprot:15360718-Ditylum_brightwellii.AAC.1
MCNYKDDKYKWVEKHKLLCPLHDKIDAAPPDVPPTPYAPGKIKQEETVLSANVTSAAMSVRNIPHMGEPKTGIPKSSGKFDNVMLGILWDLVIEKGGNMLDSSRNLIESSNALAFMLGDMYGSQCLQFYIH